MDYQASYEEREEKGWIIKMSKLINLVQYADGTYGVPRALPGKPKRRVGFIVAGIAALAATLSAVGYNQMHKSDVNAMTGVVEGVSGWRSNYHVAETAHGRASLDEIHRPRKGYDLNLYIKLADGTAMPAELNTRESAFKDYEGAFRLCGKKIRFSITEKNPHTGWENYGILLSHE